MTARRWPRVPYGEIDPPIVNLVRALNQFPGVHTIGSCGGHRDAERDQAPEGQWYILFEVDKTSEGWMSLEFLGWAIGRDMRRAGSAVTLRVDSAPPWLNYPGEMIRFLLDLSEPGRPDDAPDEVADWLRYAKSSFYVSVAAAAKMTRADTNATRVTRPRHGLTVRNGPDRSRTV